MVNTYKLGKTRWVFFAEMDDGFQYKCEGIRYSDRYLYESTLIAMGAEAVSEEHDWVEITCDKCHQVWRVNHVKDNCYVVKKQTS